MEVRAARQNLIDRHYYTTSSARENITLGPLFLGSLPAVTSSVAFWIAFALLTIGPAIAIGTIAAAWAARHPLPGFAIASIALLGAVLGFALGLIVAPFVIVAVLA